MIEEMKPCPFCGGNPHIPLVGGGVDRNTRCFMFNVRCSKCGVGFPGSYKIEVTFNDGELIISTDERTDAIKDWNSRKGQETCD